MDRKECTICSCEEEQVSLAVVFARAFSLGAASQRHNTLELYLRECLCLRHCDLLQQHRTWSIRNAGKEPPWPEEEPGL